MVLILDILRPELIDLKGSMVDPDPGLTLMDPIGSRADSNLLRTGPDSEPIYVKKKKTTMTVTCTCDHVDTVKPLPPRSHSFVS